MNTRNAANTDKGPDEVTDPSIQLHDEKITSEKSDEDVAPEDVAPEDVGPEVTPRLPTSIGESLQAAVDAAVAHLRAGMHVHHAQPGEVTLNDVIHFLKKEFPCFVLFTRMGDAQLKDATADGKSEWKVGMAPTDKDPPKREYGVFLNGPETAYDPKVRRVVMKWLDMNTVRDFSKSRIGT